MIDWYTSILCITVRLLSEFDTILPPILGDICISFHIEILFFSYASSVLRDIFSMYGLTCVSAIATLNVVMHNFIVLPVIEVYPCNPYWLAAL